MRTRILVTTLAATFIAAAGLGGAALLVPSALAQGATSQAAGELSAGQIIQRLEAEGYTAIDKVERERDYVEVKATDPQGRRVELKLDPVTGQILKTETKQDKRSRDDAATAPQR